MTDKWADVEDARDIARRMQGDEPQLAIIQDVLPDLGPDQRNLLGERIDDGIESAVKKYLDEVDYER